MSAESEPATRSARGDALRIVHVASGREWRGGERQVYLLARELARCGLEQVVVTRREGRLAREVAAAGIPVAGVPWNAALSSAAVRAAWRAVRGQSAILHAHDGHAITVAALASLVSRRPYVATRRTAFPVRRAGTWRRAARVVAVSDAVRQVLVAAGIPEDRVAVVPSGIDVEAARSAQPIGIREQLGLAPDTQIAVNVAAFTQEKAHDTLIRGAALLAESIPSLHWVLAGDGPLRPHLTRMVRDLGLVERIHFVGWIDDPLPLIAAGDVFVLPSTLEGVGTVLLDALAMGAPVVATRAGGIPETVGDAGLLVPVGSEAEFATAVAQALLDPAVRARLASAARGRAEQRTAGGMAAKVRDVYRSVAVTH